MSDLKESFEKALSKPGSNDYAEQRASLLSAERDTAWDEPARLRASQSEKHAAEIIKTIREDERRNLFGNVPGETIPGPETRDMGGKFLVNLPQIEQSKIYEIAKAMPKGCHLHVHFNAEIPSELLLVKARELPGTVFVRSSMPLVSLEDFDDAEIVFGILPDDHVSVDIFDPAYRPEWKAAGSQPWMKWRSFQDVFPEKLSNKSGDESLTPAEAWARDKIVLSNEKVNAGDQTCNGIWATFNQGTRAAKGLMACESIYRWCVALAIDRMVEDGIMYTEWRPMLMDKTISSDDGRGILDHAAQMTIISEVSAQKRAQYPDKFLGVKVIYCTPRSIPRTKMQSELLDCLALKRRFPDLICGFDLVGAEDRPNHIGFYADLLIAFQETCSNLGLDIPFLFHAGESLLDTGGSANPQNSNLYDAVLLGSKRISHGYALLKHPLLVKRCVEKNICIELCPISNELLHLCSNVKEHQFPQLLAAGMHCCLNSDNPALFRGASVSGHTLSHEFYQVMVGSSGMSLHGWHQMAIWSIEHSCMSPAERGRAMTLFEQDWEVFCDWIVQEYKTSADSL